TARGFGAETSPAAYNPPTPSSPPDPACGGTPPKGGSDCPTRTGTIRVKNKNVEIRDTQWLSANVAKAFPGVDTQRVAVTGGSYGGGESWLQAAEPNWTFPNSRDSSLPVLKLQVAVPKYPWTDLAASLAPNGRIPGDTRGTGDVYTQSYGPAASTPAAATDGNGTPFGVGKLSYVTALQALGTTTGDFGTVEPTPQNEAPDPEINPAFEPFAAWQARIANVELPYSIAPKTDEKVISDVRRAFSHWHSAYYQPGWKAQDAAGQHTAVYSVSGWTDDLFPTVESFRMFKLLKGLDSRWPVEVEAADIGHSRAGNPSSTWQRINASAFGFLKSQISGAHEANTGVSSQLTTCSDRQNPPAQRVSAQTPERLGNGTLTMSPNPLHPAVLTPATGAGDPDGVKTDAVVGGVIFKDPTPRGSCTASTAPPSDETFGYRSVSSPLTSHRITVGIGYVDAEYAAVPGTAAQIAARVWDVAPDGTQLLISRGVYRLDPVYGDAPSGRLRVPFYGNHFDLPVGHKLRLDLQQQDDPTYLPPSPTASTVTLKDIHMVLPTRSAGDTPLAGS
ncbi:MAG: type transport system ATP-binding protein, partial [Frankiaceae bacterium]|nr:type transport system ATP-binding protein [Frankiaceae bacterium]